jgi:hypothetical protein
MAKYIYEPPPTAKAFMKSTLCAGSCKGPIGSGKSTACVMEVIRRAKQQVPGPDGKRRTRWAVIRNTYPELKTTTIKTWHQWVPTTIGRWRDEGPPTHIIEDGDLHMEVMFIALDRPEDIRKLLSLELTGAWMNEAREIPKAVLDGLTGRVGRYPSARDGGPTWKGIIMDTNPPDTDHWWYKLAEEQRPEHFEFFSQPGGLHENAENRGNLPSDYYEKAVLGKDQDWVKVYVHGEYGFVRDGKPVYPLYVDSLHCREFDVSPKFPMYCGIDFGLTPAACFLQQLPSGQIRVHSELVTEDMGALRFGELLNLTTQQRYPGYEWGAITGDPAGDIRAQTDETTPFQILKAQGIMAQPAHTNDFVKRTEAVNSALARLVSGGEPGIIIHPNCKQLRKAMAGGYCYKRVQVTGQERFRDMPDKNGYSHVAESLQYALLGLGIGKEIVRRKERVDRPVNAITDYNIFS